MPYGEQDMLLQEHYKNLMSDEGEMIGISCDCFNEADIIFSLILVPTKSELRGFCLLIFINILLDYRQKKPLKYYVPPHIQGGEE